jgi:hypothetical protein
MRRTIAFLTGFSVVAVAAVAFGFVRNGSEAEGGFGGFTEPGSSIVIEPGDKPATTSEPTREVEEVAVTEPADEKPPVTEPADEKPPVTEPADLTPPALAILHPIDGQVFSTKEVVFEGTTEVGARVFAGPYEADVRDDGSWRIVLFLAPGQNLATFIAKDGAGNVTEAKVSPVLEEKEHEEEPKGEFSALQQYGECSENPPYDVFYGTARPGTKITVVSEFGDGVTEVNDSGHWEIKVTFPESPFGLTFLVKVIDSDGHSQAFEFTHTG